MNEETQAPVDASGWPSVGRLVAPLVERLIHDADALRIGIERSASSATLVDAGIGRPGGLEAGRRIAEICMAGLGRVAITGGSPFRDWPWQVEVGTANPVLACLASQYAGWSLAFGEGKEAYHAMASGPGRAQVAAEDLFEELGYRDRAERACLVLETGQRPPGGLVRRIAEAAGRPAEALTLILTPTESLAGIVQIVARVLEVALHKVHVLGFPLARIVDGLGRAPLPPPAPSMLAAMGRSNDAILFGGEVQLLVGGSEEDARELAVRLPSSASRDYGRPFAEVFAAVKGDFYAIDPMLFSPARVQVTALASGRSFTAGRLDEALIARSFGGDGGA